MATVGDLVDRAGLLSLTPGPAEKARRDTITAVYEVVASPPSPSAGNVAHLATSVWSSLGNPERIPVELRSRGAVAVVVDTDDASLSAEFVGACVQQSLPIFMLPRSATIADVHALLAPPTASGATGVTPELLAPIDDALSGFTTVTGMTAWLVMNGCVVTTAPSADFELLEKTLARTPAPLEAISSKSAAVHLVLPRSGHALALINKARKAVDPRRIRDFADRLDVIAHAIALQRATRRDLEHALIRELIETQVPSAALDPWVASFGLVPGDRVRAVAVIVDGEPTGTTTDTVAVLHDLGLVGGSSCVAAAHGDVAYALIKTSDAELRNPLENSQFDEHVTTMTKLVERRRHLTPAVGVSSYVIRSSDDLMRGLINARQLAERQARAAVIEAPQIALPVPLAATLLRAHPGLSEVLEDSLLQPVIDYDTEKGTSFIETLRTFFALDGHWGATANELGIHINTLRYRLSRVEQLTGRGFQSTADRSDYYLALCLRESAGHDERSTS